MISAVNNIDIEIFKTLISKSVTWTQVMMYFKENHGYKNLKNHITAKKRCIKENIDFSHFVGKKPQGSARTLDEILVKDSYYDSRTLKKRLIKNGTFEYKCRACKITDWNGKPITLQLEHINGDHYDNRIENLELLCPNCHSQTDTFTGKNVSYKKISNKCLDCEKYISLSSSVRCVICSVINQKIVKYPQKPDHFTKKCKDCETKIAKRSTRCPSCAAQHSVPRKIEKRPTLEQLKKISKIFQWLK